MGDARLKLPPALESARRFVLVRYADFQDVRAGRVSDAAWRVAQRARKLRIWTGAGLALVVAMNAFEIAAGGWSDWSSLYLVIAIVTALAGLTRLIKGLDELASPS